jgi:2,3,4,5-tetrahydropyridine-2-carboxylate N-succinyltransferase
MQAIQQIIDEAWENRSSLQPGTAPAAIGEAVASVLDQLDQGTLRVAEKLTANGSRTNGSRKPCCCRSDCRTTA